MILKNTLNKPTCLIYIYKLLNNRKMRIISQNALLEIRIFPQQELNMDELSRYRFIYSVSHCRLNFVVRPLYGVGSF